MSEVAPGLRADVQALVDDLASVFLSEADAVDRGDLPIDGHLDALARAGLYGAFAPPETGGLGLRLPELCAVVEELASCCLASTFVWVQHFRLLGAVLSPEAPASWREPLLGPVVRGEVKGGVALTGLMPGPVRLQATATGTGWRLRGEAPWVSGWGVVAKLFVAARTADDEVVSLVVEAEEGPGLSALPLRLAAADATRTVRLGFDDYSVPPSAVLAVEALEDVLRRGERLRLNGSFALGVARRCTALLGPSPLDRELSACRASLGSGDDALADARARASELAVRCAHALAVQRGSRSAQAGDVAERLSREAAFLLVFASRPAIKQALLHSFGAQA